MRFVIKKENSKINHSLKDSRKSRLLVKSRVKTISDAESKKEKDELSAEEIKIVRELIDVIPDLLEIAKGKAEKESKPEEKEVLMEKEPEEESEEEHEDEIEENDVVDEESEEDIISDEEDSDETGIHDSANSVQVNVHRDITCQEEEIASSWNDRYSKQLRKGE